MPHIYERYDYVVSVYIVYNGRTLLVNHPRYKKWLPVGGHIELEEDPEEALFREIIEETGLKEVEILSSRVPIKSPETKFLLTPNYIDVHAANLPHRHIALTYFARSKTEKFILSAEHTDMKWFSIAELDENKYKLSPGTIFYAKEAIKKKNPLSNVLC